MVAMAAGGRSAVMVHAGGHRSAENKRNLEETQEFLSPYFYFFF